MELVFLPIGLLIGGFLSWYIFKLKNNHDLCIPKEEHFILDKEKSLLEARLKDVIDSREKVEEELKHRIFSETDLRDSLVKAQSETKNLLEKLEAQKKDILQVQEKMTIHFENMAKQILDQNSDKFSKIQHERISFLLNPLKEKIAAFEKKVEDGYKVQHLENGLLKNEIQQLVSLNQQMSEDAKNLTKALKGDNKVQGNWGEVILERILERSGLKKEVEYVVQGKNMNLKDHEGKHLKPDVIVLLPEGKHIIIDAKASLKAFEAYIKCEEPEEQKYCLKQHVTSIKNHIKELGDKFYQQTQELNSPDFVLMFLPVEASFSIALQYDNGDIFNYGWERKIVIVSPTTLLATLRTIASIWKNEKQNKNAMKIAEESGKLYDKFHSFVNDLERIGKNLQNSQVAYDEAMRKLCVGKGNLLTRAEKLKSMGINTKKSMDTVALPFEGEEAPLNEDLQR